MGTGYSKGKYGFGVLLLLIGSFLLAGNLGYIPSDIYHTFLRWPSILVLVGLFQLSGKDYVSGSILLAIGSFFLLPHLMPGFYARDVLKFWPLLLIFAGAVFIFNKRNIKDPKMFSYTSKEDFIQVTSIFGGGVTRFESENFQGGEITCVFGGSEVNFQSAKLSHQGAVIELIAIFGGTKLMIPRDWNVRLEVVSVFGGFSDKRFPDTENNSSSKTLVIKGVAIFGGGEIIHI